MRKMSIVTGLLSLLILFLNIPVNAAEESILQTQKDKISYSIGVSVGNNFRQKGIEADPDILVKGLKDALSGGKLLMTEDDVRITLDAYQKETMRKLARVREAAAEKNKKEGEIFLAENKKKAGIVTLPSGLQYKIIKATEGRKPLETDTVECHYRGTLINGKEFDSSFKVGKPAILKVQGVIRGWTEALKLMSMGSKWQLFIPSRLAYGEQGAGMLIEPNATLIFDLELVAIK